MRNILPGIVASANTGPLPYHASAIRITAITDPCQAFYDNDTFSTPDSAIALISHWIRNPRGGVSGGQNAGYIASTENGFWTIQFYVSHISYDFWNAAGDKHYFYDIQLPQDTNWHHVMTSVDTNHPAHSKVSKAAVDGIAAATTELSDSATAFNIGWTAEPPYVGLLAGGIDPVSSHGQFEVADFWMGTGQYADASDSAVIAKFRDPVTGKPVYLGANGELPTGISPTIFGSGTAVTFMQPNLGTSGPFDKVVTGNGSIVDAATSPSN
jgi:hypothetical protein